MWFVYILKCSDGTFYTGITMDLKRRVREHNGQRGETLRHNCCRGSLLGAKYTSGRRPVKLVYSRRLKNRSLAAKEECRIKKMAKKEKMKLIRRK